MAEIFGKYQLHEKIAQGGMAEVFVASQQGDIGGFERRLAIKRVFPHLVAREEIITMFIDEARIASRLHHPNIVQIYDLGVVNDQFFIAMEYVEGLDLRRVCELGVKRRNFIPRPLAVYVVAQVAAGLHYAHRRTDDQGRPMNIIHRDVSPQNVLISVDGAVKICDFGIAKAESRMTETQVGEFKGKFSYMSPEQFGTTDIDHRSDIFTLGIVLYETTAGTRLFKSESEYDAMRRITAGEFRPPRQVRPDYPEDLEKIVLRALATDREDRYPTAEAFYEDLEEWLFEQRVRIGPRQLAEYLNELMDDTPRRRAARPKEAASHRNPPEPVGTSDVTTEPMGSEEVFDKNEEDTTLPSALADGGSGSGRDQDADEEPTAQMALSEEHFNHLQSGQNPESELEDDATLQDLPARKPVAVQRSISGDGGDSDPDGDRADAVEIKRISPEEAKRRRQGMVQSEDESDGDDDTTFPFDGDPTQPAAPVHRAFDPRSDSDQMAGDDSPRQKREKKAAESERNLSEEMANQPDVMARQGESEKAKISVRGRPEARGGSKSSSSTSSLIGSLPELNPGGRQLTPPESAKLEKRDDELQFPTQGLPQVDKNSEPSWAPPFGWTPVLIGGAVLGSLILLLLLGTVIFGGDDEESLADSGGEVDTESDSADLPQMAPRAPSVGDKRVDLHLETQPEGARVVANGFLVDGVTPLDVALVDERDNEVWIFRRRHRAERLLIPAKGEDMEREIELESVSALQGASVEFRSTPTGARVSVNGDFVGETPIRMANVRTDGPVHVQFELQGYRPYVAFVDLEPEERKVLEAELSSEDNQLVPGSYGISPSDSRVLLQGKLLDRTPFDVVHRDGEWLELEIENPERESIQHRLRLDQIGGFALMTNLVETARQTGKLTVYVEPDAAVYVDHRAFGAAPLEGAELPAGEQTVVFEKIDGRRLRVPLDVEADGHSAYRVRLHGDDADVEPMEVP